MNDRLESRLLETIADILNVPNRQLKLSDGVDVMDEWDSLAHLNIILGVEETFGIRFPPKRIFQLTSIEVILAELKHLKENGRT